jgi:hypothetical protein
MITRFKEFLVLEKLIKTKSGWKILSKKGKPLGFYKTKGEALKRLRQIEWFKKLS